MTEPATWGLRRRLLDLTDKVHLARPAVQLYELALAARSNIGSKRELTDDGLPIPPARLRAQVGPLHADADFFLRSGRGQAELVRDLLAENGTSIEDIDALLDWGCGCGRILRHWRALSQTRVCGCDINPKMIEWCRTNLPFADVTVNELEPPLPYPDSSFDLVYAFSVFTHLPQDLQHAWMRECLRVLRAGGSLLFSTLGEYYASLDRLTESEQRSFADGELVVLYQNAAGTSLCSAYHPREYVHRELADGFEVVSFRPAADEGRHDIHLFRKPVSSVAAAER